MEDNNEENVIANWDTGFQNPQVKTEHIPDYGDVDFELLKKAYQSSGFVLYSVLALVPTIVILVLRFGFQKMLGVYGFVLIGILFFYALMMLYTYYSYYFKGFAVRKHDILYKKGLFWRSILIIPFSRIQHCEIDQGPIDRFFGLTSLNIFTAGGTSSDLAIPGLEPLQANRLKEFILIKTAADEEE